jgi:hypothetical protein
LYREYTIHTMYKIGQSEQERVTSPLILSGK